MENVIISGIQDGFNEEEIKVKTIGDSGSDLVRGSLRNHCGLLKLNSVSLWFSARSL